LHKAQYCRTNEYDVAMLPQVSNYVQLIEQAYRQYAPEHHAAQLAAISEVRSDWKLFPGSSISSITSNWCFPTFCHRDSRDFKGGLGCLVSWYHGKPNPVWLVFPKYRIAVLYEPGDVLLADVGRTVHANTLHDPVEGYGTTSGRLAVIFYLRPGLKKCKSAVIEMKRRDIYLAKAAAKRLKKAA
jgi:hypothetical protein